MSCLFKASVEIKRKASVDLCRHPSRYDLEDLNPEVDEDLLHDRIERCFRFCPPLDGVIDEMVVFGFVCGGQDEGGIRRCVGGLVFFDFFDLTGVGDDGGHLPELIEFTHTLSLALNGKNNMEEIRTEDEMDYL